MHPTNPITALVLRDKTTPPVRVLEVDGPRFKGPVQRGEGQYYLATDNQPQCEPNNQNEYLPHLAEWGDPYWEIYLYQSGWVNITANRPTDSEIGDGDMHGSLGSTIIIDKPDRTAIRNGLRIARRLAKCPADGCVLNWRDLTGIREIQTDLDVRW